MGLSGTGANREPARAVCWDRVPESLPEVRVLHYLKHGERLEVRDTADASEILQDDPAEFLCVLRDDIKNDVVVAECARNIFHVWMVCDLRSHACDRYLGNTNSYVGRDSTNLGFVIHPSHVDDAKGDQPVVALAHRRL